MIRSQVPGNEIEKAKMKYCVDGLLIVDEVIKSEGNEKGSNSTVVNINPVIEKIYSKMSSSLIFATLASSSQSPQISSDFSSIIFFQNLLNKFQSIITNPQVSQVSYPSKVLYWSFIAACCLSNEFVINAVLSLCTLDHQRPKTIVKYIAFTFPFVLDDERIKQNKQVAEIVENNSILPSTLLSDPPTSLKDLLRKRDDEKDALNAMEKPAKRKKIQSTTLSKKRKVEFGYFSAIPFDIVAHIILFFLNGIDLMSFRSVCKEWREVYKENANKLWKNAYFSRWNRVGFKCVCYLGRGDDVHLIDQHNFEAVYARKHRQLLPLTADTLVRTPGRPIINLELELEMKNKWREKLRICPGCNCSALFRSKKKLRAHLKAKHSLG